MKRIAAFQMIIAYMASALALGMEPGSSQQIDRLIELCNAAEARLDFVAAHRARTELIDTLASEYGADHWVTREAKLALQELVWLEGLGSTERRQFLDAREHLAAALIHFRAGSFRLATKDAKAAAETLETLGATESRPYGVALSHLARCELEIGDAREALKYMLRSQQIALRTQGPHHPSSANGHGTLALVYRRLEDFPAAEESFSKALNVYSQTVGPADRSTCQLRGRFASFYRELRRFDAAEALLQRNLAVTVADHPEDRLNDLCSLSLVYNAKGSINAAKAVLKLAQPTVARLRDPYKEVPFYIATSQVGYTAGHYGESLSAAQRAMELLQRSVGAQHSSFCIAKLYYARAMLKHESASAAEQSYEEGFELTRMSFGEKSHEFRDVRVERAVCYQELGRWKEAEIDLDLAIEANRNSGRSQHPHHARALLAVASARARRGAIQSAQDAVTEATQVYLACFGADHFNRGHCLCVSAEVALQNKEWERAERELKETIEVFSRTLGPKHPETATAKVLMARTLVGASRFATAEVWLREGLEARERTFGGQHPLVREVLLLLADVLTKSGRLTEAKEVDNRANAIGGQGKQ